MNAQTFATIVLTLVLFSTVLTFSPNAAAQNVTADIGGPIFQDDISGKYEDAEAGYTITFPDGWSGISFLGNFPMVAPGGFLQGSGNATILVFAINRTAFEEAATNQTFFLSGNLTDNPEDCGNGESSFTTINGMSAFRAVEECDDGASGYKKSEVVGVINPSHIILLGYEAHSQEANQLYYKNFLEAQSTFKVNRAQDFRATLNAMTNMRPQSIPVQIDGNTLDVTLTTSSTISELSISKEDKRISFSVEGMSGTRGTTTIAVQDILQGPYSVTIDGNTTAFTIIKDDKTSETLIEVMYPHSKHAVVITGTQVIPEFPFPILGIAVASIMVLIVAISRTRLKGCFVQDS
jgi:hypothetical protein